MEPAPAEKPVALSDLKKPAVIEIPAQEIRDFLEAVPLEQRKKLEMILFQQSVMAKSHRGPLPPPEDFEKYCSLIPNGGERIMARYEKQSDHRIDIEKSTIKAQMAQSNAGQWMGFCLGLVGLGIGGFCISTGHDVAGATLGGTTLIGLVSVFVAGKTEMLKSLFQKRPDQATSNEADSLEGKRQIKVRREDDSASPEI